MALARTSTIGENTRMMIKKMNSVGLGRIVKWVKENHPKENVERNIQIIRSVAKNGYAETAYRLNVSRQATENVCKRYYGYALQCEVEGTENGK